MPTLLKPLKLFDKQHEVTGGFCFHRTQVLELSREADAM